MDFIQDVFRRRFKAVEGYPVDELATLLGANTGFRYNEHARQIRSKKKPDLWGVTVAADLCSGDIHYLINLVDRMVRDSGGPDSLSGPTPLVSKSVQSEAIRTEAGQFLSNLRGVSDYGERAVAVVTAFGNVAHSYLLHKEAKNEISSPPHQASRIEPYDQLDLPKEEAELYRELLRYSVFIEEPRGKSRRGKVVPRLYLRRFLVPHFNLTFSKRDSIELSNVEIVELLRKPTSFEDRHRLKKQNDPRKRQPSISSDQGELF